MILNSYKLRKLLNCKAFRSQEDFYNMAQEESIDDATKLLASKVNDSNESDSEMDVNEITENTEKSTWINNVPERKLVTSENREKKRKRGRRGGRRRGGGRNMTNLTDLPDGILLVEDGDYVGYHCTYCNCVLGSITTVKDHIIGFRHQLITETKGRLAEEKQNEGTIVQSESENLKNDKEANISESNPLEEPSGKSSLPIKSCLEDDLATVSDPVIGLDYITEKRKEKKEPSFECSLCDVTSNADDMKVHILGTRHRLMYLKTKDPQKIAELMTKNLQKAERNTEIKEYIELLKKEHGSGTIVVKISDSDEGEDEKSKSKRMSGAQRRYRKKQWERDVQNVAEQSSIQKAFQKKGNRGASGKQKKGIAGEKSKNPYGEAPARKKQQRGRFQRDGKFRRGKFVDRNEYPFPDKYYQNYDYRGQLYQTERNEERLLYGNYPHDSPLDHNRKYQNEQDPVNLSSIDVTNEEEAGVVMNVINSLTERFLQYKLQNISGPAKEILEKSLKGEGLLPSLSGITSEKDKERTAENVSYTSKPPKEDIVNQCRRNFSEIDNIVTSAGNPMEKSLHNWNNKRDAVPTGGGAVNLPQQSLDENRDTTYPREKVNQSQGNWKVTKYGQNRDVVDQSPRSWHKDGDVTAQPQHVWNETRGAATLRNRMDKSDWDDNRDTIYSKDRMNQSRSNWNETRNGQSRDVVDQSPRGWHKDRDMPTQPQRIWNETSGAASPRNRMDQSHHDWNETRNSPYGRDVTNQSNRDWNEGKDTTSRNLATQPQHDWDDARDTWPRVMMDRSRREWNENKSFGSLKNEKSVEQSQRDWGETRRYSEENQNAHSFSQFSHRQTSNTGKPNIDSFSQSCYGSGKHEEAVPLRNSNFDSFNQHGQRPDQHTWHETDPPATKGQNFRYFSQSTVGWSEKNNISQLRSATGSFPSQFSHHQGSTSSLPVKRNVDYSTFVDDMFDNYQKKVKAADQSRSTVTGLDSGNHRFSSFTAQPQHASPPASLTCNRPITFGGQKPSVGIFPSWK